MIGTMPTQGIDSAPRARFASACDLGERLIVLAVYVGLVARLIVSTWQEGQPANLLLIPSEGLVVIFLLFRRRTDQISMRWQDWILALSATLSPMLVEPGVAQALVPVTVGAALLIMGTIIQVHAKLTLGRSFGCVPAHRGLKLAGPYRFVRHPMYAGYLLGHVAFLLMNPTLWNVAAYAVCYALQIPRLVAEERLLANDRAYREYQAAVKYRLIPGIF
ncbi:MAG TPA: isoprenylcysteine carboxylmethyltransferase family protein [Planctomycetaceae bacterium]